MKKPIEQATAALSRAAGSLNIMIACRRLSRARVREAAALALEAAELLDSVAPPAEP